MVYLQPLLHHLLVAKATQSKSTPLLLDKLKKVLTNAEQIISNQTLSVSVLTWETILVTLPVNIVNVRPTSWCIVFFSWFFFLGVKVPSCHLPVVYHISCDLHWLTFQEWVLAKSHLFCPWSFISCHWPWFLALVALRDEFKTLTSWFDKLFNVASYASSVAKLIPGQQWQSIKVGSKRWMLISFCTDVWRTRVVILQASCLAQPCPPLMDLNAVQSLSISLAPSKAAAAPPKPALNSISSEPEVCSLCSQALMSRIDSPFGCGIIFQGSSAASVTPEEVAQAADAWLNGKTRAQKPRKLPNPVWVPPPPERPWEWVNGWSMWGCIAGFLRRTRAMCWSPALSHTLTMYLIWATSSVVSSVLMSLHGQWKAHFHAAGHGEQPTLSFPIVNLSGSVVCVIIPLFTSVALMSMEQRQRQKLWRKDWRLSRSVTSTMLCTQTSTSGLTLDLITLAAQPLNSRQSEFEVVRYGWFSIIL